MKQITLLKTIGNILAFAGGVIAFFASLGYFFEGGIMPHLDYNKGSSESIESLTIVGVFILLIGVLSITLALLGSKPNRTRKSFICLIILGAGLLATLPFIGTISTILSSFIAGLLIVCGGIIGEIGNVR